MSLSMPYSDVVRYNHTPCDTALLTREVWREFQSIAAANGWVRYPAPLTFSCWHVQEIRLFAQPIPPDNVFVFPHSPCLCLYGTFPAGSFTCETGSGAAEASDLDIPASTVSLFITPDWRDQALGDPQFFFTAFCHVPDAEDVIVRAGPLEIETDDPCCVVSFTPTTITDIAAYASQLHILYYMDTT
jgi:hypothetical protein